MVMGRYTRCTGLLDISADIDISNKCIHIKISLASPRGTILGQIKQKWCCIKI